MLSSHLDEFILESKGKLLQLLIKENILGSSKVLAIPRNHRFFESFNKEIEKLLATGIIKHFAKDYHDFRNPKRFKNLEAGEVMTLEHLEAGFAIWFASLIFPITSFVAEWAAKFKKFIIFKGVFEAFVKTLKNSVRRRDKDLRSIESKNIESNNQSENKVKNQSASII